MPFVYGAKLSDTCVDFEQEVVSFTWTEMWRSIHAEGFQDSGGGDRYDVLTPQAVKFLVTSGKGREAMKDKCKNLRREQGKHLAQELEKNIFGLRGPADAARKWLGKDLLGQTGESCTQA